MLKKRLIPKLLIKSRKIGSVTRPILVTTKNYSDVIEVGDPVSQAKIYEAQLADELIVLNIDSNPIRDDDAILALIQRLATETFMPLAVGGVVRSPDDFGLLLDRGADKVSINTMALECPQMIGEAANRFGEPGGKMRSKSATAGQNDRNIYNICYLFCSNQIEPYAHPVTININQM